MTDKILPAEEVQRLRGAATEGPWGVSDDGTEVACFYWDEGFHVYGYAVCYMGRGPNQENAAFIAALPDIAASHQALHAENERLKRERDKLASICDVARKLIDYERIQSIQAPVET